MSEGKLPIYERHGGKLLAWIATVIVGVLLGGGALLVGILSYAGDEEERARQQTPPTSGVTPTRSLSSDVPPELVGAWFGEIGVHEKDSDPVWMKIEPGAFGDDIGTIRYKSGCVARLRLAFIEGVSVYVEEVFSDAGACLAKNDLRLDHQEGSAGTPAAVIVAFSTKGREGDGYGLLRKQAGR
ncbi:hypothetical protein AB0J63_41940 [Streptosporangium canum]|uniref:hypothetical protein n=1 Tax=Streptosporangium canum TaxID=324952 RepID=UPI00341BFF5F